MAYGILIPLPGIELGPHTEEAWSLNQWTTRKVPKKKKPLNLMCVHIFYFCIVSQITRTTLPY